MDYNDVIWTDLSALWMNLSRFDAYEARLNHIHKKQKYNTRYMNTITTFDTYISLL